MSEQKIRNTFEKMYAELQRFHKVVRKDGLLEKNIMEIGGDPSHLNDMREHIDYLMNSLEDAEYGSISHLDMKEQLSKKKKITPHTPVGMVAEGVLDGDDEDGFMARSQLYFLARDAIALHSMISDQEDLQPWIQSKIAQSSKDIDAVRRYTEYKDASSEDEGQMEGTDEGYSVMPSIDREKYQERDGLEGPFQTKSGKVIYYDTKEGSYYDPNTDMYISYDEWKALDESTRLDEFVPIAAAAVQAALAAGRYVAPWLIKQVLGKGASTVAKRAMTRGAGSAAGAAKALVKKAPVKTASGAATRGAVATGAATYGDEQDARSSKAVDLMKQLRARDDERRSKYYTTEGGMSDVHVDAQDNDREDFIDLHKSTFGSEEAAGKAWDDIHAELNEGGKHKYKSDAQRKAVHAAKMKEDVTESEERPYVCVHAKKGKHECDATSSYGAAKKAAEYWGLKSTAGIDAHLADKEKVADSVQEQASMFMKSIKSKLGTK